MAKTYSKTIFGQGNNVWEGVDQGYDPCAEPPGRVQSCVDVDFSNAQMRKRKGWEKVHNVQKTGYMNMGSISFRGDDRIYTHTEMGDVRLVKGIINVIRSESTSSANISDISSSSSSSSLGFSSSSSSSGGLSSSSSSGGISSMSSASSMSSSSLMYTSSSTSGTGTHWSAYSATLDPLNSYLKASYQFTSGGFLNDTSGNSHTLTNNGSVTQNASGKNGDCSEMSGSNHLSLADDADFDYASGDFIISFWFNTVASGQQILLGKRDSGAQFAPFLFYANGNTLYYLGSFDGASWGLFATLGTFSDNTWTHVIATRNGSTFTGYFNNSPVSIGSSASSVYSTTASLNLGGTASDFRYTGKLDEVYMFKGAGADSTIANAIYGAFYIP